MCGIVGYIGSKSATEVVLEGLKTLEYRGYDSAGIALLDNKGTPKLIKQVGRVEGLEKALNENELPASSITIGHTRWATHGTPTLGNAHPHSNTAQTIFVAHNGIIENHAELRQWLQEQGYVFISDTDTEVIPHLIDHYYEKTRSFEEAFVKTIKELRGAYAILAVTSYEPEKLFAARLSSPMVIGVGEHECFIASDPVAVRDHTENVVYVQDNEMVVIGKGTYDITDLEHSAIVKRQAEQLDFDADKATLGDFPNFTLKEIFEAPQTIRSASLGRTNAETRTVKLGGLEIVADQLNHIDRIVLVACGTASYAGRIGEYFFEEIAGIPAEYDLASEFKYRKAPLSRGTVVIALSQSGETADTIAALQKVEKYGVLRLGVVNAVGSTVARMTDAGVYCHAGAERAVASTKAFLAQVLVLLQIALFLGRDRSPLYADLLREIESLPGKAEAILKQAATIEEIAKKYQDSKDFMLIGRRYNAPMALEGALKMKEMALIHAEGYAAGELKHGSLALIDENFPTFAFANNSPMYEKTCSNIQEVKARKGRVVAIATEGNEAIKQLADDVIYVPDAMEQVQPILNAIVIQLFCYYIAMGKGYDIDRPRNLAKSVTVE